MSLPQFQDNDRTFQLMQSAWASLINPVIDNPANQSVLLQSVSLTSGDNIISHKLQRRLQGWKIVRQRSSASIYDKQDSNSNPTLTLILNASANVVVDLECF